MATIKNDRDVFLQNRGVNSRRMVPVVTVAVTSTTPSGVPYFTFADNSTTTLAPASITLTATATGAGSYNSPTYAWYYSTQMDPTTWINLNTATAAYTVSASTFASQLSTGGNVNYKVVVSQTGWSTTSVITAIDGYKNINTPPVINLTNETVLLPVTNGTVDYTKSATNITVSLAGTNIPYDTAGTAPANSFTVSAAVTGTTITLGTPTTTTTTVTNDTRSYPAASGLAVVTGTATVTYTITVRDVYSKVYTYTKVQTISGYTVGQTAKTLNISSDSLIFTRGADNVISSPSFIKFTANKQNTTNTVTWTGVPSVAFYTASTGGTTTTTGDTVYLRSADYGNNTYVNITANISADSLTDTTAIASVKTGSSALQAVLSNYSAPLPTNTAGTVTYTGSGTTIQIYEGSTLRTITGISTTGSINITPGAVSGLNTTTVTIADHSAITANNASVKYNITCTRGDGTSDSSISITQAVYKSLQGATGSPGNAIYAATVYQQIATQPTSPVATASIYNFSTNALTPPAGWSISQPATSTTPTYACDYTFVGAANSTVTGTGSWSSVYLEAVSGNNATAYWLVTNTAALQKNTSNVFSPTSITATGYSAVGTSTPTVYAGRFKIYESGSATASYTSAADESLKVYTPSASSVTSIKVEMYLAGGTTTKLDEQTIPVVVDGAAGTAAITGVLSNETSAVPADNAGTVSSFVGASTTLSIFNGTTDDSANWTYSVVKTNVTCTEATTSRTQTVTALSADTGYIDFTATRSGFSNVVKRYTISKAKGGIAGTAAITGVLSNETSAVPADNAGTVSSFAGASTTLSIFNGSTDDSANWTYSVVKTNVTCTEATTSRTQTVTALSADTGYIDFTATRVGYGSIAKRYTISKAKGGIAGNNATAYWLVTNTAALQKNTSNVFNPTSVTATGYNAVGTSTPTVYAGRFKIYESGSATASYTSAADESLKVYTPSASTVTSIKVELYLAGGTTTKLDEQTIPVVVDGATGTPGEYRAMIELYQNASSAPTVPTSVPYTFSTNTIGTVTGGTGTWTMTKPDATAATPTYMTRCVAATTTPATAVTLTGWSTAIIIAQLGSPGADGNKYITINAFQWAASAPSAVTTTPVNYTFSSGAISAFPTNWTSSAGSPSANGMSLYQLNLTLNTSATGTAAFGDWVNATRNTIGYRNDGGIGPTGQAARTAYIVTTSSTVPGAVTAGTGDAPPSNTVTNQVSAWSFAATSSLAAGQYMYQVDGLYTNGGSITWGNPYLANLKVGSLSAIAADLGNVSVSTVGGLYSGTKAYGDNTNGFFLGYSGTAYKFQIGQNNSSGIGWDGTTFKIRDTTGGTVLSSGNVASDILNSGITIGSNGALSGAGGGQVSISGLGYTGSLDATNGIYLNRDPNFTNSSYWTAFSGSLPTFTTTTTGYTGSNVIRSTANTMAWINESKLITINPTRRYKVSCYARTVSGTGNVFYLGVALFDSTNANISGDGSQWYYAAAGVTVPTAWTYYSGEFGVSGTKIFPANAVSMSPLVILSYGGVGTNVHEVQSLSIIDVTDAYNASLTATWAGVTGANKPADNANNTYIDANGSIQGVSTGANTAVANSNITITGGSITGIGTGANTAVANSNITITGGSITGIGTGANTAVANSNITITGGSITGIGTGANTVVDNSVITISGRNILTKANILAGGATVTAGYDGLNNAFQVVLAAGTNYRIQNWTIHDVGVYSISFWIKSSVATAYEFDLCDQALQNLSATTSWQYVKFENLTVNSSWLNTTYFGFLDFNPVNACTLTISNLMLEFSNKASAWTPAPEDTQNANITISSGAISGIGTGSGTVVDNSSITITGGSITGIGTGANTAVANSNITINSGSITGIGAGAGTAVANSNITISSGSITGIGTGAGTAVANSNITITGGSITGIGTGANTVVDNTAITITGGSITGIGTGANTAVANSNITINSGSITGIGAGAGTAVANSNITISSGSITGIGTGAGTAVANSNITITGGSITGIGTGANTVVANNSADSVLHIMRPIGGNAASNAANTAGSIKIKLPQSWTNTMLRFQVDIYEYGVGGVCTYEIGGYNYAPTTSWANNPFARYYGPPTAVRAINFGHDGTNCCIWIGAAAGTWQYPQVQVHDFVAGYSNFSEANWGSGWAITWDTGGPLNVTATVATPVSGGAMSGVDQITSTNVGTYIAAATIGTTQIADAAITNAKIGNLAVDTAQIAAAAITNAKIGSLAVDTAQIAAAAVTTAKIASLAVDTAQIATAAITSAKIANLAVTTATIADNAVTASASASGTTATVSSTLSIPANMSMVITLIAYIDASSGSGITTANTLYSPSMVIDTQTATFKYSVTGGLGKTGDSYTSNSSTGCMVRTITAGTTAKVVTVSLSMSTGNSSLDAISKLIICTGYLK